MWRVILGMAVPMALAQLVNVAYSIVDRMYIGHIPGVGSYALTGLGLTMPVVSIITALANLCGMGGGPVRLLETAEEKRAGLAAIMAHVSGEEGPWDFPAAMLENTQVIRLEAEELTCKIHP